MYSDLHRCFIQYMMANGAVEYSNAVKYFNLMIGLNFFIFIQYHKPICNTVNSVFNLACYTYIHTSLLNRTLKNYSKNIV